MKISLNWLKDYIEFDPKLSVDEIAWRLTEATAEIEGIVRHGKGLDTVVVGELVETKKHPDADKLFVGKVKVNSKDVIQVIYGQKAVVEKGDKIPTAIAPCILPGGKVEQGKIRGQLSEGMLCLDSELIEGASETLFKFPKSTKVGTPVTDLLPLEDVVFEIDNHSITHRSDLFSHIGFARECVALSLAKWKKQLKEKDPLKLTGKKKLPLKPSFADKHISKNYYSTVISGVSTKESPPWLRYRLQAVGIRSLNAIVDITNYGMMEWGQPSHAFDLRFVSGNTFEHRLSKQDEKITTLDGTVRKLQIETIVVDNGQDIIDLSGIMGAENSEIKEDTNEIYLHVAEFNPVLIRRAIISTGLRTEGSTMHEKNIEAERVRWGYVRYIELFKEVFPEAKFNYETFHAQHQETPKVTVKLPFEKMTSHLGIEIKPELAQQYLEGLGFTVKPNKKELNVEVPPWRALSVTLPEDIIEEVVRIHGYSKVPALPPTVELSTPVKNHKRQTRRTLQAFLTGQGFQEEANFSFLSESLLSKLGPVEYPKLVEIANPVSEDFRFMRPNFLPYLLNNLSKKQIREMKFWKSFEMGAVYHRLEKEVTEEHLLTLLIASPNESSVFPDVKTGTSSLLAELSLDHEYQTGEHDYAHPGRCLALMGEDETIGHIYELHPLLKDSFKLKGSVAVVEMNMDKLYQLTPKDVLYQHINRNPEALLDINVVVESGTMMSEIDQIIHSVESKYLKEAELVDVYEGENLGKGKKSFTFALSYQHPERTLEEKEIQEILDKLIKALEKAGGVVRR